MKKSKCIWQVEVSFHLCNVLQNQREENLWWFYVMIPENTTMDKLGAPDVAVASSVSKIFASTLTYPHEVWCYFIITSLFQYKKTWDF